MTRPFIDRLRHGILIVTLMAASSALAEQPTFTRAIIPDSLLRRYNQSNEQVRSMLTHRIKLQTLSVEESAAVLEKLAALPPHNATPRVRGGPLYPQELRKKGITGTVEAILLVSSNGTVSEVYLSTIPHPDFARPVAIVLKQWRFAPNTSDFAVKVPIPFRIAQDSTQKEK